ncbi:uncharacterized protein LOC128213265 [Mya arenaria]|uniref:uncharacterized protein LOC128213265 n=1 Tax=Mya arenaria TaxID=6604 RepID=UPI0022E4AC07|nr:uncharacterized protein LOC128213265 [Mya arenaria]
MEATILFIPLIVLIEALQYKQTSAAPLARTSGTFSTVTSVYDDVNQHNADEPKDIQDFEREKQTVATLRSEDIMKTDFDRILSDMTDERINSGNEEIPLLLNKFLEDIFLFLNDDHTGTYLVRKKRGLGETGSAWDEVRARTWQVRDRHSGLEYVYRAWLGKRQEPKVKYTTIVFAQIDVG